MLKAVAIGGGTTGGGGGNLTVSAGTNSISSGLLNFENSNGVSFGMDPSGNITGSVSPSAANLGISAGTNSTNASTVNFSNSNGISFGMNTNAVITASYTVPTQSNQTVGLYGLGNTTQNSSTTLDARSLSLNGLGIVTVGYSNGSIQLSATTAAQTNQSEGWYAVGNTTQNSSTTLDARTHTLNGLGIITVGYSNGSIQLSATTAAQTNQSLGLYAVGNTTQNSSTTLDARTLSFDFLGAATGGFSNGSIQVSAPVQTNQTVGLYALGNTTDSSSTTLDARSLSLSGSGNITVGFSNGSIIIGQTGGGGQSNQTLGWYAVGNTTQNSSTTLDARTLSIDGLGGITAGFSNGSIQISGPQTVAQTNQTIGYYAVGNTTQNSSTTLDARTVSFNGLGGITVGFSNGSIDISGPQTAAQTNQSLGWYAVGNTTQNSSTTLDARTISIDGLGGITAGFSNGSIQISGPVAQTVQTEGWYAVGNTTQNSSTTLDARTHTLNGLGIVTVGYSNGSIDISASQSAQTAGFYAVGNTTQNSSTTLDARTLSFNGLGIVTVGFSNGSIDISATTAAQTNQTLGWYAVGNTTQNSSTTLDARTLSFQGAGAASVGYSNGSIIISAPNAAAGNVTFSAGGASAGLGSVVFSNSNGVSFGLNGSTITASVAAGGGVLTLYATSNTTNNSSTTFNASSLVFEGDGGVSVGFSNGNIQISGATGGGGGGVNLGLVYAIAAGNLIM